MRTRRTLMQEAQIRRQAYKSSNGMSGSSILNTTSLFGGVFEEPD